MTDDEYREFLAVLVRRHVQPKLPRLRRRFHHHMMEEWHYHLDQAERLTRNGRLGCFGSSSRTVMTAMTCTARSRRRASQGRYRKPSTASTSAIERLTSPVSLTRLSRTWSRSSTACALNICRKWTRKSSGKPEALTQRPNWRSWCTELVHSEDKQNACRRKYRHVTNCDRLPRGSPVRSDGRSGSNSLG